MGGSQLGKALPECGVPAKSRSYKPFPAIFGGAEEQVGDGDTIQTCSDP